MLLAVALGVFAGVTLLGGWVIWRTYDRSVEAPLLVLTDAADRISVGELREPVPSVGPLEIDQLAHTMELMRAALVNEIDTLEQTRAALEARGADLERSNQDLEQFAYVASHDLQEPLRKVTSFCQLLQQRYGGQLDERADEYIAYAVDGAKRMQILINDLLSSPAWGARPGRWGRSTRRRPWRRRSAGLSVAIDDHQASVVVGDLPEVWGEPALLETVFANLLGNALKFHREGQAPIVHVDAAPAGDDGWIISVQDEGIGIAPEHHERVFEIFRRLHTRDVYEGTGIGLALCRKIVESFGGKIWVDPAYEGGTTGPDALALFPPPRPGGTRPVNTDLKVAEVLLVEDDPGDVLITREALALSRIANNLHHVSDGDEAMAFLNREGEHADAVRPDLILLDLNLPGRNGREVLAEVKASPELRQIPVVVLTTSRAEEDVLQSYDLHANAYVSKPVDFEEFTSVVGKIDDFFFAVAQMPPPA